MPAHILPRLIASAWVRAVACLVAGVVAVAVVSAAPLASGYGSASVGAAAPSERDVVIASRSPITLRRDDPPTIHEHVVQVGETLADIAIRFGVTADTLAIGNGLGSANDIHEGEVLKIPPMNAAIYAVQDGDTIAAVAARFGADASAVVDVNRLTFEPDNFAPGKTILVPVASGRYPGFVLKDVPPERAVALARGNTPASGPISQVAVPSYGRLSWPVAGVITQYFSAVHTGVDLAAPYGTPIGASDAGVVSAAGWVAVGGLRVCVRHDWGMETCYYHTSVVYVSAGQYVARGQAIAAIGLTGVTTGPHVHWEARYNGVLVNPLAFASAP